MSNRPELVTLVSVRSSTEIGSMSNYLHIHLRTYRLMHPEWDPVNVFIFMSHNFPYKFYINAGAGDLMKQKQVSFVKTLIETQSQSSRTHSSQPA